MMKEVPFENSVRTQYQANRYIAMLLLLSLLYGCDVVTRSPALQEPDHWLKLYYTSTIALDSEEQNTTGNIPILCYHQIREWLPNDSRSAKTYIVTPANFNAQMELLYKAGYHTILPDQLISYLRDREPLPSKPILITFDDGTSSQYTNALPVLEKDHFKAVFFIMTVTLDRPRFMSSVQVKELSDKGHVIGCHTWNHHNVTKYNKSDWELQLEKPTKQLQQITGKPVTFFAYPFGAWDEQAIEQLKLQNYTAAFQLYSKTSSVSPYFAIRRIIVDGHWSLKQFSNAISIRDDR